MLKKCPKCGRTVTVDDNMARHRISCIDCNKPMLDPQEYAKTQSRIKYQQRDDNRNHSPI